MKSRDQITQHQVLHKVDLRDCFRFVFIRGGLKGAKTCASVKRTIFSIFFTSSKLDIV